MRSLLVAVVLLASTPAHAEKQPSTAFALSAAGTGASAALVIASFALSDNAHPFNEPTLYAGLATSIVTPSLGQWYAGEWFSPGMVVRVGAAGLAAYAVQQQDTTQCDTATMNGQTCKSINQTGVILLGLAAMASIGAASYDVRDAPHAVRRHNSGFAVVPTLAQPGLAIMGAF